MIISEKSDEELHTYLYKMFDWILDLNWPGAYCIFERLKRYNDNDWFNYALNDSIKNATLLSEDIWLDTLIELKKLKNKF